MSKAPLYLLWGATLVIGGALAWPRLAGQPQAALAPAAAAATAPSELASEQERRLALEPIRPIPAVVSVDARKVALGRRLFHEVRLSKDGTISCATCHSLDLGGADGKAVSAGVGGALGTRNSPTVFNSSMNFKQFWDGRADSLEQQVDGPLTNPDEMGMSWEEALATLSRDPAYRATFETLYEGGVSKEGVRDAIASFERSLVTPNSRFDRWLRGERDALTGDELRGYSLFKETGCTSCHQGVNVGGTMFQTLGKMAEYFGDHAKAKSADLGRYAVTGREEDRYRFKVPTLRNVALTPPYLHDGSVATLDEAVGLMARFQLGVELPPRDVQDIVKFLSALTGIYEAR